MAYTPINWQTGDTITAEKLNKMDNGWGYESTQLFSETVTTEADGDENYTTLAYVGNIDADTITVTFDGTKYVCPRNDADDGYYYGDLDFTTHPFFIIATLGEGSKPAINDVYTETASTHTVAAAVPTLQTSADFAKAASAALGGAFYPLVIGTTTWRQVVDAMAAGKLVLRSYGFDYSGSTTPNTQYAGLELVTDAYVSSHGDYYVSVLYTEKGTQSFKDYGASTADGALS